MTDPELIKSFPPIVGDNPKVLILGSMPGVQSLKLEEYYGFGRNQFWKIMCDLFGFDSELSYGIRVEKLMENSIALWDVIHSCTRKGSLDTDIQNITVNDIPGFLKQHPSITSIYLNGGKAEQVLRKYYSSELEQYDVIRLYSTSPASAISYQMKLEQWSQIQKKISKYTKK